MIQIFIKSEMLFGDWLYVLGITFTNYGEDDCIGLWQVVLDFR